MPIVVPVLDSNTPLSQGDLLKGVPLFQTGKPSGAKFEPVSCKAPYCLVISRPCVTSHKDRVVVAAVEPYKNDEIKKSLGSFDALKEFYADVRDGKSSPDQFYLGQLNGEKGSFCARLDSLHTIELPSEGDSARQQFIGAVRVARLDDSFAHDLHQRLFRSFASLGFDDDKWYPTADLEVLVETGERDRAKAEADYRDALAALKVAETQGDFKSDKEKEGREKGVANKKKVVDELDKELAPLRAELERRRTTPRTPGDSPIAEPSPSS